MIVTKHTMKGEIETCTKLEIDNRPYYSHPNKGNI